MVDSKKPASSRLPRPDEVKELFGFVPALAVYFRRAHSDMPEQLRTVFDAHGLTGRHGVVIPHLVVEPSLSVGELAARMGVSLSTTSELVGDLCRAGLAERNHDPANRRRVLVSLSESYRPMVESFVKARAEPLLRVLENLSPRDRAGFVAGMSAWVREVRDW